MNCETPGAAPPGWQLFKAGTRPPLLVGCPAGGSPLLGFPWVGCPLKDGQAGVAVGRNHKHPLLVERRNHPLTCFRGLELLQQGCRQLRLVLVVTLHLVAKPKGRGSTPSIHFHHDSNRRRGGNGVGPPSWCQSAPSIATSSWITPSVENLRTPQLCLLRSRVMIPAEEKAKMTKAM